MRGDRYEELTRHPPGSAGVIHVVFMRSRLLDRWRGYSRNLDQGRGGSATRAMRGR